MSRFLRDLYAERRPGCCLICDVPMDVPVKPGRQPVMCSEGCRNVYRTLHTAARRAEEKKAATASARIRVPMPADAIPAPLGAPGEETGT